MKIKKKRKETLAGTRFRNTVKKKRNKLKIIIEYKN